MQPTLLISTVPLRLQHTLNNAASAMQALIRWMRQNPQGGTVVFITSDNEFLREITTVHEAAGFTAELMYVKEDLQSGPGMREKVSCHYEWISWLRVQMQCPLLQLQPFSEADWKSPDPELGISSADIFTNDCLLTSICMIVPACNNAVPHSWQEGLLVFSMLFDNIAVWSLYQSLYHTCICSVIICTSPMLLQHTLLVSPSMNWLYILLCLSHRIETHCILDSCRYENTQTCCKHMTDQRHCACRLGSIQH